MVSAPGGDMARALKWGFLGAGWIADIIAQDFARSGLHIVAVGARTAAGAHAFADKHGVKNRHEGYDGLVNDPEVDIVYISTPQHVHKRDALRAIAARKHVLLEKPFALDASEAEEIAAAAGAAGVFCMEAMWTRFLPSMQAARRVLASGVIGAPVLVTADHSQLLTAVPRLWDARLGGGALLDLGVYPVSFIMAVFGAALTVARATGTLTPGGVDESIAGALHFAGGGVGSFTASIRAPGPVTATVMCTRGRLDLGKSFYEQCAFTVFDAEGRVLQRYDDKVDGRGMQFEALHVEECVRSNLLQSPVMPLTESVGVMRALDQLRAQVGVEWPRDSESVPPVPPVRMAGGH